MRIRRLFATLSPYYVIDFRRGIFRNMAEETLIQEVKATIAEQLGVDIGEVSEEKSFIEDLNADSLDLTELIMTLEEKFDLTIADDQAEKLKTVKDVIDFVRSKKA